MEMSELVTEETADIEFDITQSPFHEAAAGSPGAEGAAAGFFSFSSSSDPQQPHPGGLTRRRSQVINPAPAPGKKSLESMDFDDPESSKWRNVRHDLEVLM